MNSNPEVQSTISELELPKFTPEWLSGVFEAGGTMEFRTTSQNIGDGKLFSTSPTLVLNDNSRDRLERLQKVAGGNVYTIRNGYFRWAVTGKKAVRLIDHMKPFCPSRREMMAAVENWEIADRHERLQIAREMQKKDRTKDIVETDYEQLVTNPDFLAGVIDSRGVFRYETRPNYARNFRSMSVRTINKSMLDALKSVHGGEIRETKEFEAEKVSYQWELYAEQSRALKNKVQSHLIMRGVT